MQTEICFNSQRFAWLRCNLMLIYLLCLLLQSPQVNSSTLCYYGSNSNVNSLRSLQIQSCSDGELHIADLFNATDEERTIDTGTAAFRITEDSTNQNDKLEHSCFVFRHIEKKMLGSHTKMESVSVEYACDFHGVCKERTLDKVLHNVIKDGHIGKLYCCTSDKCNTNEKIPHAPSENRLCYTGPVNKSGKSYANLTFCSQPDTKCAKSFVLGKDGKRLPYSEKYFCDDSKNCQEQLETTGASSFTTFVTNKDNLTEEIFCCEGQKCYLPPWEVLGDKFQGALTGPASITPDSPREKDSAFMTGLISTIVLVVVFMGAFIIAMYCRRRYVTERDPDIIVPYKPLLNADVDFEEAVDL